MDVTIYLPDLLGARAKKSGLNLSRLLRVKLEEVFASEDVMTETLDATIEVEVNLVDEEGRDYVGRFMGTRIAMSDRHEVYLSEDRNVVVYDSDELRHWIADEPEDSLRDVLDEDAYRDAMHALGVKPKVDLAV